MKEELQKEEHYYTQNTKPVARLLFLGFHPKSSARNHRLFDESAPLSSETPFLIHPPMNGNLLKNSVFWQKQKLKRGFYNPFDLGPLKDLFTR